MENIFIMILINKNIFINQIIFLINKNIFINYNHTNILHYKNYFNNNNFRIKFSLNYFIIFVLIFILYFQKYYYKIFLKQKY